MTYPAFDFYIRFFPNISAPDTLHDDDPYQTKAFNFPDICFGQTQTRSSNKKHFYGKVTWSEPTACGRLLGGAGEILPLLLEREMLTKTWVASKHRYWGWKLALHCIEGGGGYIRIMEARSERRINNKMNEKKLFNVEREKWECLKETKWYDG